MALGKRQDNDRDAGPDHHSSLLRPFEAAK